MSFISACLSGIYAWKTERYLQFGLFKTETVVFQTNLPYKTASALTWICTKCPHKV